MFIEKHWVYVLQSSAKPDTPHVGPKSRSVQNDSDGRQTLLPIGLVWLCGLTWLYGDRIMQRRPSEAQSLAKAGFYLSV